MINKLRQIFLLALAFGILGGSFSTAAQTQAWGKNGSGQLALNSQVSQRRPTEVSTVPEVTAVAGGYHHTLFLRADGTVQAAGRNSEAELATGIPTLPKLAPVDVLPLRRVTQISGGGYHSAALKEDGTVWSWGFNSNGQIGNGTIGGDGVGCGNCFGQPTRTDIDGVIQIDAGFYHTLALKADGTVWAWGYNGYNQLGIGVSYGNYPTPVQVGVGVAGFENIVAIAAGDNHSMALKADGTVWSWGDNGSGQVGNNSTSPAYQNIPTRNTTLSGITQIAAGTRHSVALKADGTVWVWGDNYYGQIGKGTSNGMQLTPLRNTVLTDIIEIRSDGGFHTLAKKRGGAIWAWGANEEGQIGNGTVSSVVSTPVEAFAGDGNVLMTTGASHSFASKPSFTTRTGVHDKYFGAALVFSFDEVTAEGKTSYAAINPTTVNLTAPATYLVKANAPAYNISTTAATNGNTRICLKVQSETDETKFNRLKLLRGENGYLVDYTSYIDFRNREVCATTGSLSSVVAPFVIAEELDTSATSVAVSGKVMNSDREGISRATVTLTDSEGNIRKVMTDRNGEYIFPEVATNRTYIASVSYRFYHFDRKEITVDEELSGLNFYANE